MKPDRAIGKAFALALKNAVTAETDEQAKPFLDIAQHLSRAMKPELVEAIKKFLEKEIEEQRREKTPAKGWHDDGWKTWNE